MTPPPSLPLSPADRERLAAVVLPQAWEDAARAHGVDPRRVTAKLLPVDGQPGQEDAIRCALRDLAEALEGLGYAVDWSGGTPRVTGWAAARARVTGGIPESKAHPLDGRWFVRIVDLDEIDPRVDAYHKGLFAAREARRGPAQPDTGRQKGVQRHEGAYPRGGR